MTGYGQVKRSMKFGGDQLPSLANSPLVLGSRSRRHPIRTAALGGNGRGISVVQLQQQQRTLCRFHSQYIQVVVFGIGNNDRRAAESRNDLRKLVAMSDDNHYPTLSC